MNAATQNNQAMLEGAHRLADGIQAAQSLGLSVSHVEFSKPDRPFIGVRCSEECWQLVADGKAGYRIIGEETDLEYARIGCCRTAGCVLVWEEQGDEIDMADRFVEQVNSTK